jgi:P27 family predicted phage terminase small subunit
MGERGPLPNPNAIRRNKREVNGTIPAARPSMPRGLSGEAKAEWRRVVPEIERMGVLAAVDRATIIRYVMARAEWVELNDLISRTGRLTRGSSGDLERNPLWALRQDVERTLLELARQLALTPASRLRSGIKHEEQPPSIAMLDELRARRDQRVAR